MSIAHVCIERLRALDLCGYSPDGPWAAEPTALACVALAARGESRPALRFASQLADAQLDNGAVPAIAEADSPAWTTSLAILAWLAVENFHDGIDKAIDWSLKTQGKPAPRIPQIGHDPSIPGWSWAAQTHSWLEPTAMFVIALKAAGLGEHERTRDGVRLVTDRLLPTGGSNFGSTLVLGQATLPQVQSTGLAMIALAGEQNTDPRVEMSLRYLESSVTEATTTASLCYGLLGLTAHDRRPPQAETLVANATQRELNTGTSAYKQALLVLAGASDMSWLPGRSEAHHA